MYLRPLSKGSSIAAESGNEGFPKDRTLSNAFTPFSERSERAKGDRLRTNEVRPERGILKTPIPRRKYAPSNRAPFAPVATVLLRKGVKRFALRVERSRNISSIGRWISSRSDFIAMGDFIQKTPIPRRRYAPSNQAPFAPVITPLFRKGVKSGVPAKHIVLWGKGGARYESVRLPTVSENDEYTRRDAENLIRGSPTSVCLVGRRRSLS